MQKKNYTIRINEYIHIIVFFRTDGNRVVNFVVKLEILLGDKWLEVERYDCYHGIIHKDILDKDSRKRRVIRYPFLDKKSGLTVALHDFKENYEFIIWRYLNEKY